MYRIHWAVGCSIRNQFANGFNALLIILLEKSICNLHYVPSYVVNNCKLFLITIPDIDNNGFLDNADFECMALRACIIEGKGDCNPAKLAEYQHIMRSLWDEISDLADFDKV